MNKYKSMDRSGLMLVLTCYSLFIQKYLWTSSFAGEKIYPRMVSSASSRFPGILKSLRNYSSIIRNRHFPSTRLKNLLSQTIFSSPRFFKSARWLSSIFCFSSVAKSWSFFFMAFETFSQSLK